MKPFENGDCDALGIKNYPKRTQTHWSDEVVLAQKHLRYEGFLGDSRDVDGYVGPLTLHAIEAWNKAHGDTEDIFYVKAPARWRFNVRRAEKEIREKDDALNLFTVSLFDTARAAAEYACEWARKRGMKYVLRQTKHGWAAFPYNATHIFVTGQEKGAMQDLVNHVEFVLLYSMVCISDEERSMRDERIDQLKAAEISRMRTQKEKEKESDGGADDVPSLF